MSDPDPEVLPSVRIAARRELIQGVVWFGGAGLITLVAYSMAKPGGRYFVFWGALAYGAFRLLRGIYYFVNPMSMIKRTDNPG